jgi:hypothetical protein
VLEEARSVPELNALGEPSNTAQLVGFNQKSVTNSAISFGTENAILSGDVKCELLAVWRRFVNMKLKDLKKKVKIQCMDTDGLTWGAWEVWLEWD